MRLEIEGLEHRILSISALLAPPTGEPLSKCARNEWKNDSGSRWIWKVLSFLGKVPEEAAPSPPWDFLAGGRPRAQRKRSINARVAVTIADVGPQSHSPQERPALQPTRSEWLGEKREGDTQEGKNENGDMGSSPRHWELGGKIQ